jgi:hypothetical protein
MGVKAVFRKVCHGSESFSSEKKQSPNRFEVRCILSDASISLLIK